MADANLKGCHPIQNLGAVETYTRRYLWVTAMEIVEHDALDSSEPVREAKPRVEPIKHPLDAPAYDLPTPERMERLKEIAAEIVDFHSKGSFEDAFVTFDKISDNGERNELWKLLKPNSEVRTKITSIGTEKRKAA